MVVISIDAVRLNTDDLFDTSSEAEEEDDDGDNDDNNRNSSSSSSNTSNNSNNGMSQHEHRQHITNNKNSSSSMRSGSRAKLGSSSSTSSAIPTKTSTSTTTATATATTSRIPKKTAAQLNNKTPPTRGRRNDSSGKNPASGNRDNDLLLGNTNRGNDRSNSYSNSDSNKLVSLQQEQPPPPPQQQLQQHQSSSSISSSLSSPLSAVRCTKSLKRGKKQEGDNDKKTMLQMKPTTNTSIMSASTLLVAAPATPSAQPSSSSGPSSSGPPIKMTSDEAPVPRKKKKTNSFILHKNESRPLGTSTCTSSTVPCKSTSIASVSESMNTINSSSSSSSGGQLSKRNSLNRDQATTALTAAAAASESESGNTSSTQKRSKGSSSSNNININSNTTKDTRLRSKSKSQPRTSRRSSSILLSSTEPNEPIAVNKMKKRSRSSISSTSRSSSSSSNTTNKRRNSSNSTSTSVDGIVINSRGRTARRSNNDNDPKTPTSASKVTAATTATATSSSKKNRAVRSTSSSTRKEAESTSGSKSKGGKSKIKRKEKEQQEKEQKERQQKQQSQSQSPKNPNKNQSLLPINSLDMKPKLGMHLEACDKENIWSSAKIVKIHNPSKFSKSRQSQKKQQQEQQRFRRSPSRPRNGSNNKYKNGSGSFVSQTQVTIRYDGWGKEWDETLDFYDQERIAPLGMHTMRFKCIVDLIELRGTPGGTGSSPSSSTSSPSSPSSTSSSSSSAWPCIVNIRTPSSLVDLERYEIAEEGLRIEPNIFIQPYGLRKNYLPFDITSTAVNGGRWIKREEYVHGWRERNEAERKKKTKLANNFNLAYRMALRDEEVLELPEDAFEEGTLIKAVYRTTPVGYEEYMRENHGSGSDEDSDAESEENELDLDEEDREDEKIDNDVDDDKKEDVKGDEDDEKEAEDTDEEQEMNFDEEEDHNDKMDNNKKTHAKDSKSNGKDKAKVKATEKVKDKSTSNSKSKVKAQESKAPKSGSFAKRAMVDVEAVGDADVNVNANIDASDQKSSFNKSDHGTIINSTVTIIKDDNNDDKKVNKMKSRRNLEKDESDSDGQKVKPTAMVVDVESSKSKGDGISKNEQRRMSSTSVSSSSSMSISCSSSSSMSLTPPSRSRPKKTQNQSNAPSPLPMNIELKTQSNSHPVSSKNDRLKKHPKFKSRKNLTLQLSNDIINDQQQSRRDSGTSLSDNNSSSRQDSITKRIPKKKASVAAIAAAAAADNEESNEQHSREQRRQRREMPYLSDDSQNDYDQNSSSSSSQKKHRSDIHTSTGVSGGSKDLTDAGNNSSDVNDKKVKVGTSTSSIISNANRIPKKKKVQSESKESSTATTAVTSSTKMNTDIILASSDTNADTHSDTTCKTSGTVKKNSPVDLSSEAAYVAKQRLIKSLRAKIAIAKSKKVQQSKVISPDDNDRSAKKPTLEKEAETLSEVIVQKKIKVPSDGTSIGKGPPSANVNVNNGNVAAVPVGTDTEIDTEKQKTKDLEENQPLSVDNVDQCKSSDGKEDGPSSSLSPPSSSKILETPKTYAVSSSGNCNVAVSNTDIRISNKKKKDLDENTKNAPVTEVIMVPDKQYPGSSEKSKSQGNEKVLQEASPLKPSPFEKKGKEPILKSLAVDVVDNSKRQAGETIEKIELRVPEKKCVDESSCPPSKSVDDVNNGNNCTIALEDSKKKKETTDAAKDPARDLEECKPPSKAKLINNKECASRNRPLKSNVVATVSQIIKGNEVANRKAKDTKQASSKRDDNNANYRAIIKSLRLRVLRRSMSNKENNGNNREKRKSVIENGAQKAVTVVKPKTIKNTSNSEKETVAKDIDTTISVRKETDPSVPTIDTTAKNLTVSCDTTKLKETKTHQDEEIQATGPTLNGIIFNRVGLNAMNGLDSWKKSVGGKKSGNLSEVASVVKEITNESSTISESDFSHEGKDGHSTDGSSEQLVVNNTTKRTEKRSLITINSRIPKKKRKLAQTSIDDTSQAQQSNSNSSTTTSEEAENSNQTDSAPMQCDVSKLSKLEGDSTKPKKNENTNHEVTNHDCDPSTDTSLRLKKSKEIQAAANNRSKGNDEKGTDAENQSQISIHCDRNSNEMDRSNSGAKKILAERGLHSQDTNKTLPKINVSEQVEERPLSEFNSNPCLDENSNKNVNIVESFPKDEAQCSPKNVQKVEIEESKKESSTKDSTSDTILISSNSAKEQSLANVASPEEEKEGANKTNGDTTTNEIQTCHQIDCLNKSAEIQNSIVLLYTENEETVKMKHEKNPPSKLNAEKMPDDDGKDLKEVTCTGEKPHIISIESEKDDSEQMKESTVGKGNLIVHDLLFTGSIKAANKERKVPEKQTEENIKSKCTTNVLTHINSEGGPNVESRIGDEDALNDSNEDVSTRPRIKKIARKKLVDPIRTRIAVIEASSDDQNSNRKTPETTDEHSADGSSKLKVQNSTTKHKQSVQEGTGKSSNSQAYSTKLRKKRTIHASRNNTDTKEKGNKRKLRTSKSTTGRPSKKRAAHEKGPKKMAPNTTSSSTSKLDSSENSSMAGVIKRLRARDVSKRGRTEIENKHGSSSSNETPLLSDETKHNLTMSGTNHMVERQSGFNKTNHSVVTDDSKYHRNIMACLEEPQNANETVLMAVIRCRQMLNITDEPDDFIVRTAIDKGDNSKLSVKRNKEELEPKINHDKTKKAKTNVNYDDDIVSNSIGEPEKMNPAEIFARLKAQRKFRKGFQQRK